MLCICCSYSVNSFLQSLKPSPHLFAQLSKVIKLSKVQEVSKLLFPKLFVKYLYNAHLTEIKCRMNFYIVFCFFYSQVIFGLALLNSFSSDLRGFGKWRVHKILQLHADPKLWRTGQLNTWRSGLPEVATTVAISGTSSAGISSYSYSPNKFSAPDPPTRSF